MEREAFMTTKTSGKKAGKSKTGSSEERRIHMRFREPGTRPLKLSVSDSSGTETTFSATLVNESFSGVASVYVGNEALEPGSSVIWWESEQLRTPCEVIRCYKLEVDVYFLALKIILNTKK